MLIRSYLPYDPSVNDAATEEFPFMVLGILGETFTMAVTEDSPESSD
jgi:hypothetical protein